MLLARGRRLLRGKYNANFMQILIENETKQELNKIRTKERNEN